LDRMAAQDGNFDVEKALADFLADPSCMELQLPHMTTGQRKQAKKLVDQYPEIKCESYGFGPDRSLHLFKGAGRDMTSSTNEDKHPSDRSTESPASATPNLSKTSSEDLSSSALDDMQDADDRPLSPELICVRNTFIHVESANLVDARVVQSMPHGMFSKCWSEEVGQPPAQLLPGVPCIAAPAPVAVAPKGMIAAGAAVVIEGLTKCPAFNGLCGTVQSFDDEDGRYKVLLASTDSSTGQFAKIKAENLRLRGAPQPPFESVAQRPRELTLVTAPEEYSDQCPAAMPLTPEWQNQSCFRVAPVSNFYSHASAYPAR